MGKKRTATVWVVLAQGLGLTLGIYLAGILLLALLLTRGMIPADSAFPATAALLLAAALSGGLLTARRTPWGTLPSALLNTALLAVVLVVVGLLWWQEEIRWLGRGGILLLCALAGGVLAGILAGRRPKRRKKR